MHPDYLLRSLVLEEMRQHWIELTPRGEHMVVAGYVRDGQLELALDRLDAMLRAGVRVQSWLFHLVVYTLLDREEIDEALRLVKARYNADDRLISPNLWHILLDTASRAYHVRNFFPSLPPPLFYFFPFFFK